MKIVDGNGILIQKGDTIKNCLVYTLSSEGKKMNENYAKEYLVSEELTIDIDGKTTKLLKLASDYNEEHLKLHTYIVKTTKNRVVIERQQLLKNSWER